MEMFQQLIQTVVDEAGRIRDAINNRATERVDRQQTEAIIQRQSKRIRPCDGSTPSAVREYVADIEMAAPYVQNNDQALNRIVADTAQGSLKRTYERFMDAQANRDAVTWQQVRTHLQAAFLSADEQEHLRTALDRVQQTDYERNAAYNRRFQEAADDAYPVAGRNAAEDRIVLTTYIKGLRDRQIVQRLVQEARPQNIQQAVTAVEQFTADAERLTRYGWTDPVPSNQTEPMEVNEVAPRDAGLKEAVVELTRQMAGVQKQISKLNAAQLAVSSPNNSTKHSDEANQLLSTVRDTLAQVNSRQNGHSVSRSDAYGSRPGFQNGRPICYACGQVGHVRRECRNRQNHSYNTPQQYNSQNQGN